MTGRPFKESIESMVRTLREEMQVAETCTDFYFRVDATGRLHDGDIRISYQVGEDCYTGEHVKGNDPRICLEEYLRRHGWDTVNAPLSISFVEDEEDARSE
tara:strand:+ start:651 stop:953 length:303 start_codon:yes stop_codon:yes gene_type:complete